LRYLLAGPDNYSLKQKLAAIKASLGGPEVLSSAISIFEGARLKAGELRLTVDALPFLTPCRLVIINGLLARFQPAADGTVKKASKLDDPSQFAEAIKGAPPSTALILIENELHRGNALFKAIADAVEVHEFPPLDKPRLKEWIGRRVADSGARITPGATNLLSQYIGADLWAMAGEIEKLALAAGVGVINETDVRAHVGYTAECSIFSLVDAILERRLKAATEALETLKTGGLSAGYVLAMLSRQLRLIMLYLDLKNRGEKDTAARKSLGVTADFVWKKTVEQSARFNLERLKAIYRRLLDADLASKTGQMDEAMAIDLLVAELASGALPATA